jgi:hypothetical protein
MGNAAECMMELQAEEAQWQAYELAQLDEPRRPLLCWADGELEDIFDWEPGTKLLGIFLAFHRQYNIGRKCFLSKGVPREGEVASGFNSRYACDKTNGRMKFLLHRVMMLFLCESRLILPESLHRVLKSVCWRICLMRWLTLSSPSQVAMYLFSQEHCETQLR